MKTLTAYFKFSRLANTKSSTRLDCTAISGKYDVATRLLRNKQGGLHLYLTEANHITASAKRKADLSINKGDNISSIYIQQRSAGKIYAYGDWNKTDDAILFVFDGLAYEDGKSIRAGAIMEMYIAEGQKHYINNLFQMLIRGSLNSEIEALKKGAENCIKF